jgi:formate dehydrogenase subunit beta
VSDLSARISRLAFEEMEADYLLTITSAHGNAVPVFLAKGDDLGDLRTDVPYQMANLLLNAAPYLGERKIAVIARRCDEKAIAEMSKRGLLDLEKIAIIGLACDTRQVSDCRCSDPCPSTVHIGECVQPMAVDEEVQELLAKPLADRLEFWTAQFRKCNKCYGCTINCPVCFCDECLLEEKTFTPEKGIPPGFAFHLIRSMHLADKCVECGECERSCPADIPLLALRKMVNRDIEEMHGFVAGDAERVSPLLTTLEGEPMEDDENAC